MQTSHVIAPKEQANGPNLSLSNRSSERRGVESGVYGITRVQFAPSLLHEAVVGTEGGTATQLSLGSKRKMVKTTQDMNTNHVVVMENVSVVDHSMIAKYKLHFTTLFLFVSTQTLKSPVSLTFILSLSKR